MIDNSRESDILPLSSEYSRYLIGKKPILSYGKTVILDESRPDEPNRPNHYNIIIVGDSSSSVDFGIITGTLKGWYFDGTDWNYNVAISTGLSGTTLTFQSSIQYVAFADDDYYYIQTNAAFLTKISKADNSYHSTLAITTTNIVGLLSTNDDAPLLPFSLDIIGLIDCDEGLFPTDYTGTTTNAIVYKGRKAQNLTVGSVAINLNAAQTTELKYPLNWTDGNFISATFGEREDGVHLSPSDFEIHKVTTGDPDTHGDYVRSVGTHDCYLARIDWDSGTKNTYLGGRDNDGNSVASDQMRDASQVGGDDATIVSTDLDAAHTTQKYYNHAAVYGVSFNKFNLNPNLYTFNDFVLATLPNLNRVTYEYPNLSNPSIRWFIETENNGDSVVEPILGLTSGIYSDHWLLVSKGYNRVDLSILNIYENASYNIDVEMSTYGDEYLAINLFDFQYYTEFNAYLDSLPDPNGYLIKKTAATEGGFVYPEDKNTFYVDSIMNYWDNTPSERAGIDAWVSRLVPNSTYEDFYDYYAANGIATTSIAVGTAFRMYATFFHSGGRAQYSGESIICNNYQPNGVVHRSHRIYFIDNNAPLVYVSLGFKPMFNSQPYCYAKIYNAKINEPELLPCLTDGSNTDVRFGETSEFPSGKYLSTFEKTYVRNPDYKTLEKAFQSNEDFWKNCICITGQPVIKRLFSPVSLGHSDKNFPAFVFKSGSSWNLGSYINDKTIVEVKGSDNVPSDFTIASGTITAAADVSFAALVLDNGDVLYYKGNNETDLHNSNGVNNGTLITDNVIDNQGTQNTYNWQIDYNSTTAITKALMFTK